MPNSFVVEASDIVGRLIRMESRGPGDTENAMRRIARRCGVDWNLLRRLRYRISEMRDIGADHPAVAAAAAALRQAMGASDQTMKD